MPDCRICLESDDVGNLISPCNCRGSSQWVHPECLNEWRNRNTNAISNRQCEICLFNYIISSSERKETFIIELYDSRLICDKAYGFVKETNILFSCFSRNSSNSSSWEVNFLFIFSHGVLDFM